MFTEADIRSEMNRLDSLSCINTRNIPIRISSRMTRTWGKCVAQRRKNQPYKVKELVFAERLMKSATREHLLEVIRHEYAHAFVFLKYNKKDGHGNLWRKTAIALGCNGQRCINFDEVGKVVKYQAVCTNCGKIFNYQRRNKFIQALERNPHCDNYICPKCKGNNFSLKNACMV